MAAVVASDPLYRLDPGATSPRIISTFQDVRRELLPSLATTLALILVGPPERDPG